LDAARGRLLLVRNRRELREGRSGWTWPKGRIDPGEGPVFAALREISEEAGVLAEPIVRIALIETRRALRHYYLLSAIRRGMGYGRETLEVRWVRPHKAARLLDRKRDRFVLRAAGRAIDALQQSTTAGAQALARASAA